MIVIKIPKDSLSMEIIDHQAHLFDIVSVIEVFQVFLELS
jgi:hypothetical protein